MNRREALRTLAAGSAAGALAAGAVVAVTPAEAVAADPCLAFVSAWKAGRDRCSAAPDDRFYDERVKPFEQAAAFGTIPAATTTEGAASALRMILHIAACEGDLAALEPQDANLIRAALAYLEGRA